MVLSTIYKSAPLPELDELRTLNWNQLADDLERVVESLSINNIFRNMLSLRLRLRRVDNFHAKFLLSSFNDS